MTAYPDYPFASHFAQVGGQRLHYLDEGHGPPVVMVHGNPTWSYYYRHVVLALRDRYRCLVPDHIGCGLSDKPGLDQYPFTLARRAEDLAAWLDGLKLTEPVSLIVHDWGGMIGCTYAVEHIEQIASVVILNTAGFGLPASTDIPWQLKVARSPVFGSLLIRGFNAFSRGTVKSCVTRRALTPGEAAAYCAPYDSWAHRLAVYQFVADIPLAAGERSWDRVQATAAKLDQLASRPMFIGWGEQDFVFNTHFLSEWRRRFPRAEVWTDPQSGHLVLDDAREELIPRIAEFLDRTVIRSTTAAASV